MSLTGDVPLGLKLAEEPLGLCDVGLDDMRDVRAPRPVVEASARQIASEARIDPSYGRLTLQSHGATMPCVLVPADENEGPATQRPSGPP
ncbi:hypothetical protein GCM10028784_16840 [Myceligenerans cantabricum]